MRSVEVVAVGCLAVALVVGAFPAATATAGPAGALPDDAAGALPADGDADAASGQPTPAGEAATGHATVVGQGGPAVAPGQRELPAARSRPELAATSGRHRLAATRGRPGRAPGTAGTSGMEWESAASVEPTVVERTTVAWSEADPGVATATVEYGIPAGVDRLQVKVFGLASATVSVESTAGFRRVDEEVFAWDGRTATARVTLELALDGEDLSEKRGVYRDGWSYVRLPYTAVRAAPSVTVEETAGVDGSGAASDALAYVGPHDRYTATGDGGERISVVVPAAADPRADPRTVRDRLVELDDVVTAGADHEETTAFVVPGEVDVGRRTGQAFGHSFWVRADQRLDVVEHTYAHEYMHTRFGYFGNGSSAWLTEATASYGGAVATLETGDGTFREFHDHVTLDARERERMDGAVLADPDTWPGKFVPYGKGRHVMAALDAEMRRRTAGEVTFMDLVDARERYGGMFEYAQFRRAVVELTGDESMGEWTDRHVRGTAIPEVPRNESLYTVDGRAGSEIATATATPTPTPGTADDATTAGTTPTAGGDDPAAGGPTPDGELVPGYGAGLAALALLVATLLAARSSR